MNRGFRVQPSSLYLFYNSMDIFSFKFLLNNATYDLVLVFFIPFVMALGNIGGMVKILIGR